MKKILTGFIVMLALFAFTACGGSGNSDNAADEDAKAVSGEAADGSAAGENAAAGQAKAVSPEELNEALELYACKVLDLYRTIEYEDTYDLYGDKNIALCDLNNDGLLDMCIFELKSGEYGNKYLDMYTAKDGEVHQCNYGFFNPKASEYTGLQFVFNNVSWGPSYALFIDAKGRPCLQAAQGGATSGEYRMVAWNFDDTLNVDRFYSWNLDASEDGNSDVKYNGWSVDNASMETDDSKVEDPQKCLDGYEKELQGIQKVIFYYSKQNDSHFSEDLLNEADENGMTYEEFIEYVTEQTGKTYEELVEKSMEVYPIS